jgi:hypothetical protein
MGIDSRGGKSTIEKKEIETEKEVFQKFIKILQDSAPMVSNDPHHQLEEEGVLNGVILYEDHPISGSNTLITIDRSGEFEKFVDGFREGSMTIDEVLSIGTGKIMDWFIANHYGEQVMETYSVDPSLNRRTIVEDEGWPNKVIETIKELRSHLE